MDDDNTPYRQTEAYKKAAAAAAAENEAQSKHARKNSVVGPNPWKFSRRYIKAMEVDPLNNPRGLKYFWKKW